ncbi:MerR family transcriptional regulator [Panacibacter ginsenosidivorans]|nr:MerR family transcriptional regulator [Panacibacter ginsenosidivorans]
MQQLDLFAGIQEPPSPKQAEKKAIDTAVEEIKVLQEIESLPEKEEVAVVPEFIPVEKVAVVENVPSIPNGSKRGRKSFKEMDAEIVMVEVPDDDILFQKQYYAISEVAKWFHVNQSLLRYWENEFSVLKPRKTRKGDRLFRPEDVKNLQLIYYLLRQRKFSIEGARQYLKDNKKKADTQMQLIQSLTKFRAFLLEWKANLGV